MRYRAAALSLLALVLVGSLFLSAPLAQTTSDENVVFSKDYKVGWIHLLLAYDSFSSPENETAMLRITRLRTDKDLRGGLLRFNSDWISGFRDFVRSDEEVYEQEVSLKGSGSNTIYLYLRGDKNSSIRIEVVTRHEVPAPTASLTSSAESITYGDSLELSWTTENAESITIEPGLGAVDASGNATVSPAEDTTYTLTATGPGGEATASVSVDVQAATEPQPQGSFGDQYEDLIPPDATIEAFEPERFAVITGAVTDADGNPLADVFVTVHGDEALYGTAKTDAEGKYSIPVNGGGNITVIFRKAGYLTTHRQNNVEWNDIAVIDDCALIQADWHATTVILDGNPETTTVHRGTPTADEDGTRAASVVFPGDVKAYRIEANGTETELTSFNVRITEFSTPETMPAELPPGADFTWCAEFQVDGAEHVRFDQLVVGWVDNFLGFEVGTIVPVGYYDREEGVWKPMDNGLVVELLDTDGDGVVDALDGDGDGQADDLNGDDNVADEVKGLGDSSVYAPGNTYWRFSTDHFSVIDLNWCVVKNLNAPDSFRDFDPAVECEDCIASMSSGNASPRQQSLNEEVPVSGTNMSLHYDSKRSPAYEKIINIVATGNTISDGLKQVHVKFEVGGMTMEKSYEPSPNLISTFVWDGKDYLGNPASNTQATAIVGYEYDTQYIATSSGGSDDSGSSGSGDPKRTFGMVGATSGQYSQSVNGRERFIIWGPIHKFNIYADKTDVNFTQTWRLSLAHHVSPSDTSIIYRGDGTVLKQGLLTVQLGEDQFDFNTSSVDYDDIATDGAGNTYFVFTDFWYSGIFKYDRDGKLEVLNVINYYSGDPVYDGAHVGSLNINPRSIDVDKNGNIFVAGNNRIFKIDGDGILHIVAGTGEVGDTGDGGPATEATLLSKITVDVDDFGNLYVNQKREGHFNNRQEKDDAVIRKITPDGYIHRIAGNYEQDTAYDLNNVLDGNLRGSIVDVLGDGTIYFMYTNTDDDLNDPILKIKPDGSAEEVCDIYLANQVKIVDGNGGMYIHDVWKSKMYLRYPSGERVFLAGDGKSSCYNCQYEGPASEMPGNMLHQPFAKRPDGALVSVMNGQLVMLKNSASASVPTSIDEIAVPDGDLVYVFDRYSGRHLRTVDQDTGKTLYEMSYDDDGKLLAITDRFGDATTMEYDANGNPSAIVSPDGHRTRLVVDGSGNLTRIVNPDGGFYQFEYDEGGLLTHKIDPEGHEYFRVYDEYGRVSQASDQEGGQWSFSRAAIEDNATGYPIGSVKYETFTAEGQRTTYVDLTNSTGYYSEITDPAGGVTSFHRSTDEKRVEKSLPCGTDIVAEYGSDPLTGEIILHQLERSVPSGRKTVLVNAVSYLDDDADGAPESATHTATMDGRTATQVTDLVNGVVTATSPEGRTTTEEYDTETLLTSRTAVPGLYDTTYQYDARGRVTDVAAGNRTTSYTYDGQGNVATVTDAQNRTTSYTYDAMDRVTSVTRPDETTVRFAWDKNGNLDVLTVPSNVDHGFEYDKVDKNTAYDPPISPSYQYIYDNDHRLVRTVFPSGAAIENVYENGQLRRVKTPEGDVVLDYLCSAKIGTVTMGAEFLNFEYDGPLVTSLEQAGELNALLTFGYDDIMRLESFGYAGGTTTFGYDLDGLLTTIGDFTIERDADNGLPLAIDDETARLERVFNGYGEVGSWNMTIAGSDVASFDLTRNDLGQIVARNETVAGVSHQYEYKYDALGRLLTVSRDGAVVEQYAYDNANGARSFETNALRNIVGREYAYDDEDHLLSAGNATFSYNADGFLTKKVVGSQETRYTYSSRGELKRVELPDSRVVEYEHDPLGRRIAKKIDGQVIEKYLWQGRTQLLAVYDASDEVVMRFEYAGGRMPVRMLKDGQTYYLAYDQVGTLRAVFDAEGSVVKTVECDSFGNVIADSAPEFAVPFGFAGGLHDRDTGLVRFGYRDYDPDTGRWTAKDPIGFNGGDPTLQTYCLGNSISLMDPEGLEFVFLGRNPFFFRPRVLRSPPRYIPPRTPPNLRPCPDISKVPDLGPPPDPFPELSDLAKIIHALAHFLDVSGFSGGVSVPPMGPFDIGFEPQDLIA